MTPEETKTMIERSRLDNLEYEEWRGKSDGLYHLSFLKTFEGLGFSTEQLLTLLMKRLDNERDIQIMEIQSRMNTVEDEPCDCDECKAERGDSDPEL
jgi:hypothetical protein